MVAGDHSGSNSDGFEWASAFIGIVIGVWICIELNAFKKAISEDSVVGRYIR